MRFHRLPLGIGLSLGILVSTSFGAAPAPKPTPSAKPAPGAAAKPAPSASAAKAATASAARAAPAGEASVEMELLPSGAMERLGGYRPQQLKLAGAKPASVKTAPELSNPALWGEIRFGGRRFAVALDEPAGQDAKLYVDSNGDGDLTNDPETKWEKKEVAGQAGPLTQYSGSFQLPLPSDGGEPALVSLGAYRFDPKDPPRPQLKTTLLYYSDYAYAGEVTLNGAKYKAMLADDNATGRLAPPAKGGAQDAAAGAENAAATEKAAATGAAAGSAGPVTSRFLIDINGDGKFHPRGESFEFAKPFNVKGTTWDLAAPKSSGEPFAIVASSRKVAEVPLPPNHTVGAKITPFTAKRMDGKTVNFPADYKGKVVLLDFWATWCGPCMAEVPSLVQTYTTHRPNGLEILGISLDQPNAAKQVKSVTAEHGMTWPQVYDGRFWKAEVAQKYGIESIPAAFLVDGDTGEILATGGALRGARLEETIGKALEKKSPGSKPAAEAPAAEAPAAEQPAAAPAAAEQPAAEPAAEPAPKQGEAVPF